jgi:hypothetical protein
MFIRRLVVHGAILGFCSAAAIGQQKPPASSSPVLREFPVVLQQNVEAGKTPVGAKVEGRLAAATVFHGTVIPRNAVFSGVVIESVAKSAKDPARLTIRMENAHWKDRSTCMKAYLMPLYYTATAQAAQSPPYESPDPDSKTLNEGVQSDPRISRPFPNSGSETTQGFIPDIPTTSSRPLRMKDVTLEPADEGGIALESEHSNIKLYRMTTYILGAVEPPPAK